MVLPPSEEPKPDGNQQEDHHDNIRNTINETEHKETPSHDSGDINHLAKFITNLIEEDEGVKGEGQKPPAGLKFCEICYDYHPNEDFVQNPRCDHAFCK